MSILSRSAVAIASLAVGSAALVAAPAHADTPSGVTRDMVLTAAAGVRANPTAGGNLGGGGYGVAANRALKSMANRVCVVDPDGPEVYIASLSAATAAGGSAEGVVVSALIFNLDTVSPSNPGSPVGRLCSFGALAPVALRSVLTGTATLTGAPTTPLSGDVFVTPAVSTAYDTSGGSQSTTPPVFSASGSAVQSNQVKVADKKSKKQKKAAKAKYDKRLKSAKKSYDKALKKASSNSKKAAAKKAYAAKKKAAKAAYKIAIANYKLVTKKVSSPFNVTAQYPLPTP